MNQLTVVIPALNEEGLIEKTLKSLDQQTNLDFAVIVADNGSSDKTKAVVTNFSKKANYSLRIIEEVKKGVGCARNTGSLKALEDGSIYLAGTDADTILSREWVQSIHNGFANNFQLLSGECDPLNAVAIDLPDDIKKPTVYRSWLFKNTKPYLRGANYALTTELFLKIGGIKQPLTKQGSPAPGEDGLIEIEALQLGIQNQGCLSTVFPHPRRYIDNVLKISSFTGSVHEGGIVTEIRNEKVLEKKINSIPIDTLMVYVNKINDSLFKEFVYNIYKDKTLKKLYWENSQKTLYPYSTIEIENDFQRSDFESLLKKYKNQFLKNIEHFIQSNGDR